MSTVEKMDVSTGVSEKELDQEETKEQEDSSASASPDPLCSCPQKCWERVPLGVREKLNHEFKRLNENAKQNEFLQSYIEMRSVYKRLWAQEERIGGRLQRRVSCKYKIPLETDESISSVIDLKTKTIASAKGKLKQAINVKEGVTTIEVCQKAFMNIYGITEKRVRLQREKLIAKLRRKAAESENKVVLEMLGNGAKNKTDNQELQWSTEQALLEAFFGNQLWRPEYIGMADAKILPETGATFQTS